MVVGVGVCVVEGVGVCVFVGVGVIVLVGVGVLVGKVISRNFPIALGTTLFPSSY